MRICVSSLSGHRIDELLADYIAKVVRNSGFKVYRRPLADKYDLLLLTNGLNETEESEAIISKSKKVPTLYFYDDYTLPTFSHMKTISQFTNLGDVHFQISELSVLDERFDNATRFKVKRYNQCYWGHPKKEREEYYNKYLEDAKNNFFIGEWERFENSRVREYERNMNNLYSYISLAKYTPIFGDIHHNGVNIPLRIYEALMNGVTPIIDKDLIGDQNFKIDNRLLVSRLEDIKVTDFNIAYDSIIGNLSEKRYEVSKKLMEIIKC